MRTRFSGTDATRPRTMRGSAEALADRKAAHADMDVWAKGASALHQLHVDSSRKQGRALVLAAVMAAMFMIAIEATIVSTAHAADRRAARRTSTSTPGCSRPFC